MLHAHLCAKGQQNFFDAAKDIFVFVEIHLYLISMIKTDASLKRLWNNF